MTLSDKIKIVCPNCGRGMNSPCEFCGTHWTYNNSIRVEHVKEFINNLKNDIGSEAIERGKSITDPCLDRITLKEIFDTINKLAGEKLI